MPTKQLGSIPSISYSPKRVAPCTSKKNLKKPTAKHLHQLQDLRSKYL